MGYEAVFEQPGDDGVVAQLEHDDEDDQYVEQEYQQETDGVALEQRTGVDGRIGVVERHDHAMHTVAGKEDGGCKADREQAVVPVAHNLDIPKELGLRHRAALGISQDSDAIAIICSEESGRISGAMKGEFHLRLSAEKLEAILTGELINAKEK